MTSGPLEPDDVHRFFREWIGETMGTFALGGRSITEDDLIEAVSCELILDAATAEEAFSPTTRRIAELFCTP